MRSTLPRATLRARRRSLRTAVGEKPPPNVSWSSQVEVVALDKDRVVVETAMRLDVAVAVLVVEGLAGLPARLAAHVCLFCVYVN